MPRPPCTFWEYDGLTWGLASQAGEARPLSRFRIVEVNAADSPLVTRLATALAGKVMADLGAAVIKIEPPEGDPLRFMPPFLKRGVQQERSALFQFLNCSKRSAVIDMTRPDGQALFARLAAEADAVVSDDPAFIASEKPPVRVLIRPSAAADELGDTIEEIDVLALGGLLDIIGDPAREPLKLGGHQCAYTAGLAAFAGLVAALTRSDGEGEIVDVSVLDVAYWTNWKTFAERLYTGRAPTRQGETTEWQVVPCRDGYAAIVYLEKDWTALCRMVGDPALQAEALATRAGRRAQSASVLRHLRVWFACRSRAEIYATAKKFGLPVAPVWRLGELRRDPQYLAQEFLAVVDHAALGPLTMPTVPVVWNGRRFTPRPHEDWRNG